MENLKNSIIDVFKTNSPLLNIFSNVIGNDETFQDVNQTTTIVIVIINTLILLYALYLSFKCMNGFSLGDFLLACCCSICYIAYRLALPCKRQSSIIKDVSRSVN